MLSSLQFIIHHFQSALFLWEMSLSFVEDRLSSMSPQGLCLLVGPTQGQKKTTAEKNKCEHKHADHLGTRTEIYCTHKHKHGGHTV